MDSRALVERSVRVNVGGRSKRSTVRVSASPSRRLPAAPGYVFVQLLGQRLQQRLPLQRGSGVVGRAHPPLHGAAHLLGQVVADAVELVDLAPGDDRVIEDLLRRALHQCEGVLSGCSHAGERRPTGSPMLQ